MAFWLVGGDGVVPEDAGRGRKPGVETRLPGGTAELIGTGEKLEDLDIDTGDGLSETGDGVIPNLIVSGDGAKT